MTCWRYEASISLDGMEARLRALPPEEASVLYPQRMNLFSTPQGGLCSLPHEEDFVLDPQKRKLLSTPRGGICYLPPDEESIELKVKNLNPS